MTGYPSRRKTPGFPAIVGRCTLNLASRMSWLTALGMTIYWYALNLFTLDLQIVENVTSGSVVVADLAAPPNQSKHGPSCRNRLENANESVMNGAALQSSRRIF